MGSFSLLDLGAFFIVQDVSAYGHELHALGAEAETQSLACLDVVGRWVVGPCMVEPRTGWHTAWAPLRAHLRVLALLQIHVVDGPFVCKREEDPVRSGVV